MSVLGNLVIISITLLILIIIVNIISNFLYTNN